MSETPIWLTEQAHQLLKPKLADLLRQRDRQSSTVLTIGQVGHDHRTSAVENDIFGR